MKGDAKVVGYLNEALKHELTAVNQYWLHYRLLDNWGIKKLADKWRAESIEEMRHADIIIARILFLEGSPSMQTLGKLHIGSDVGEIIGNDLRAEMEARSLYVEAAFHANAVKDFVTRDLFETLLSSEEGHIDFLETQNDVIARIGVERYMASRLGELGGESA
ncbi:bacterioferritin [Acidocella sp. KAb 2-4]|uniref:bacterioferritin n=1 Tax=Acidocella sp. KAb 2-4 TaxID=2885158 RepID=UPI001D092DE2|nr:bacterioferritin [Acidocella sp. KAb 2-4]MCB5944890.1 bacterioferritin [Acidocella sp. KAb 2-4]